jgi:putative ABC transport system permease protein
MFNDLMPILSTLRRHKIAAGLIVLEVALTCAIVTNALHLIQTRVESLATDSGLAESELIVLNLRGAKPVPPEQTGGVVATDLAQLRALPGVKAATATNQIAYGSNSNNSGVTLEPDSNDRLFVAAQYEGDEQFIPTLGLRLVAGRNFRPDEVLDSHQVFSDPQPRIGQVIVNQVMARKLAPDGAVVGKTIYVFGSPTTVVGIVDTLTHPQLHRATRTDAGPAMLFPLRGSGYYLVRVDPAQRDAQLKAATAALEALDRTRVVTQAETLTDMRAQFYAQDRAMAWLMGGVCVTLLLVTAMGIVGLASFWVQQRTRMIGTRRALGATEGQVLRYFQLENLLLTTAGIVLGVGGAWGLSQLLMQTYELPRLPWPYLPAGALTLWALGQAAVWAPARRAARLAPVAALRS